MNNIIKKGYTMKKILLATAFILVLGLGANAQSGTDGFFGNWNNDGNRGDSPQFPVIPSSETVGGIQGDQSGAPLGSGLLILTALGAGYVVARKRKEE